MKTNIRAVNNLILVGMPGAGKSTVGIVTAKLLSMSFVDTDILIQRRCGTSLQNIVDTSGFQALRDIEEQVILSLITDQTVIATGGSAVYSSAAMQHLRQGGTVVYLKLPARQLMGRLYNYATRGIASPASLSCSGIYRERSKLYKSFADITIDCSEKSLDEVAEEVAERFTGLG